MQTFTRGYILVKFPAGWKGEACGVIRAYGKSTVLLVSGDRDEHLPNKLSSWIAWNLQRFGSMHWCRANKNHRKSLWSSWENPCFSWQLGSDILMEHWEGTYLRLQDLPWIDLEFCACMMIIFLYPTMPYYTPILLICSRNRWQKSFEIHSLLEDSLYLILFEYIPMDFALWFKYNILHYYMCKSHI